MSVKHYKNGQLTLIAGSGGGGGEESFTGTKAEVEQAIAADQIKENWTVYITDDIEEVVGGAVEIETLTTLEEVKNTEDISTPVGAGAIQELNNNVNNFMQHYQSNEFSIELEAGKSTNYTVNLAFPIKDALYVPIIQQANSDYAYSNIFMGIKAISEDKFVVALSSDRTDNKTVKFRWITVPY